MNVLSNLLVQCKYYAITIIPTTFLCFKMFWSKFTYTIMHLVDQNALQCIQGVVGCISSYSLGIKLTTLALLAPCSTFWDAGMLWNGK